MIKIILLLVLFLFASCGGSSDIELEDIAAPAPYELAISQEEDNGEPEAEPSDIPDEYIVSLELDPEANFAQGISRIVFTNRSGEPMESIALRVYLNTFHEHMNIQHAFWGNEELETELDFTMLTLFLPEYLAENATMELLLQYEVSIPMLSPVTGRNDYVMWFDMFFPMIDAAEAANFHVEITTPMQYEVIGTGLRSEEVIEDTKTRITRFNAFTTNDFAFAVSPYFRHAHTATESGIDIHLYYYTKALEVDDILARACEIMEVFEQTMGSYPFGHISIVEIEGTFILMAEEVYGESLRLFFGGF